MANPRHRPRLSSGTMTVIISREYCRRRKDWSPWPAEPTGLVEERKAVLALSENGKPSKE
jgi:hypothetical protein